MMARSILAFVLAAWFGGETSDVREIQIAPAGAETEITVFVQGAVAVQHFMLADPARLILDVDRAVQVVRPLKRERPTATRRGVRSALEVQLKHAGPSPGRRTRPDR